MYYYDPPTTNKRWLTASILKKVLICIIFVIFVLLIKKVNLPISNKFLAKIKFYISEYNYEYSDIKDMIKEIPSIQKSLPVFSLPKEESMIFPVSGEISSGYGMRIHPILKVERMHNGIDIVQKEGTPVKAVQDGKVSLIDEDEQMGRFIKIDHGNEFTTVYAHLKDVHVAKGEQVKKGFIIGTVGKSGLAETPHLHFEVWLNDKSYNPELWLKPAKKF